MAPPPALPRPPSWVALVGVAIAVAALVALGSTGGGADPSADPELPPLPDLPNPTFAIESPTRAGIEALDASLTIVEGGLDPELRIRTPGADDVVHPMPVSFDAIRFDRGKAQYGFLDGHLRLHVRGVTDPPASVSLSEPLAFNVSSWAWSTDEPGRLGYVTFDERGFRLVTAEGESLQTVGRPGRLDLVGFDSTGFYVTDVASPEFGPKMLRRLDPLGVEIAALPADVAYLGSGGLLVIGLSRSVDGRSGNDWFLVDDDLASMTPLVGPATASRVALGRGDEPLVAFLTRTPFGPAVEITLHERGITRSFVLEDIAPVDLSWSDDDRRLVVAGESTRSGQAVVQVLEIETGLTTTLGFEDPVAAAQLVAITP